MRNYESNHSDRRAAGSSRGLPASAQIIRRRLNLVLVLFGLGGCEARSAAPVSMTASPSGGAAPTTEEDLSMLMTIGDRRFAITLADNATARSFAAQLPLTIGMTDLNDNEKYAKLPRALPTDASQPGTIRNGDIMLYGSDTLVVFYQTFESGYSYTRIGSVDDPAALVEALGRGDVLVSFSPED
jgi:hypothetical protein